MITWYTIAVIALACVVGVLCLALGFAGRRPSDLSVGSMALLGLALIAQVVIAIIAPLAGNPPAGDLLEFWMYLISAVLLPIAAIVWVFADRTRWSVVAMGVVAFALAVMVWRMSVIWTVG